MSKSIPPKSGSSLYQLGLELALRGESEFVRRYNIPALVARRSLDVPGAEPASFVTRWAKPDKLRQEHDGEDHEVFFVEKKPGSPFPERIGVGRAPNVDVAIRRDGISKYHAYFVPLSDGKYELADAGSKNGTYVGQLVLLERTPMRLEDGCAVSFGAEAFTFLMPGSLLGLLRQLNPR